MRYLGFLLFVSLPIQAMEFTKDTVYETEINGTKDETFLRNPGLDSIFIDSLFLRFESKGVPYAQATFIAGPIRRPPSNLTEHTYALAYDSTNLYRYDKTYSEYPDRKIKIPPSSQIKLFDFNMASCIFCPTGGDAKKDASARKDTILFYFIFTANTKEKDTLSVIGLYERIPTGIDLFRRKGFQRNEDKFKVGYNALGQILFSPNWFFPERRLKLSAPNWSYFMEPVYSSTPRR